MRVQDVEPALDSNPTYKFFQSTEKGGRGFCSTCGSSLTFRFLADDESIEIFVGTIDEDVLAGRIIGEEDLGEFGVRAKRDGSGLGALLCATGHSGSIWVENAVPGLTDNVPGPKWFRERGGSGNEIKAFHSADEIGGK